MAKVKTSLDALREKVRNRAETSKSADIEAPVDYDLTCWYLNVRRVIELLGASNVVPDLKEVVSLAGLGEGLQRTVTTSALKDRITAWLRQVNPPTLGQLLLEGELRPGTLFTHYDRYFCKGLSQVSEAIQKGRHPVPLAEAYAKLDTFVPGLKLSFRFHHEHLTSNSSWSELSGQRRLMVLGAATSIGTSVIEAIPWVMADPMPDLFMPHTLVGGRWNNRLEVHVDSIESFALVSDTDVPSKSELAALKNVPELDIKKAFAEIIGEPVVPNDWGGEQSDLFSSYVVLDGRRVSTAFAFKGPAKFHPMTMADLGKNGDQINRLFSEPAELLILQHCHEITPPVRDTMRAFAQQMGNPRLFCLINGYDTLRILSAYGKCGLGQRTAAATPKSKRKR